MLQKRCIVFIPFHSKSKSNSYIDKLREVAAFLEDFLTIWTFIDNHFRGGWIGVLVVIVVNKGVGSWDSHFLSIIFQHVLAGCKARLRDYATTSSKTSVSSGDGREIAQSFGDKEYLQGQSLRCI